ncbi:uncharacterized protein JCM6883_005206 [Sporobolomyces salmoneus]|uniref:uncharacterized protein n=1 Tax=Sporobolomyces salmoneus TaxID=183962 RepID=UPI00317A5770
MEASQPDSASPVVALPPPSMNHDHVQPPPPPEEPSSITPTTLDSGKDEIMTDDMRLAVSALGLLRSEGAAASSGGGGGGGNWSAPQSIASNAGGPNPEAWGTASSTSTFRSDTGISGTGTSGTSSPLTTTSIAPSEGGGGGDYFKRGQLQGEEEEGEGEGDAKFIERVAQFPLVSGGIEWYERSKANSRVVNFGAGLVESSISAVSRPITNNLQLGPLDDFACRQLDRIGGAGNRSPSRRDGENLTEEQRDNTPPSSSSHVRPANEDESPTREGSPGNQVAVQQGQRSRWQTVLLEAGGLGAAVSEESLKSLRYCLQWLVYATAHLDHQISTLRDFILSLRTHNRTHPSTSSSSSQSREQSSASTALVAASASAHLTQIKHDVVETIRKVVEVVSKYAGAALPEPAKKYVKQSIMGLPMKWTSAIENRGSSTSSTTTTRRGSRQRSESETPRVERMGNNYFNGGSSSTIRTKDTSQSREERERDEVEAETRAALGPTEEAADRVLTFAVESLDMLRSVAGIFGESVEKAEAWIERLRIVGLQRQRQRREQEQEQQQQQEGQNLSLEPPPPASSTSSSATTAMNWNPTTDSQTTASGGMKRRRGATQGRHGSVADDFDEANQNRENGDVEGEGGMTDREEMIASARRKRGARSREMSAQLS